MKLDGATFLLQWAAGGLAFCWVTTRHRQVSLGYGWLLRSVYGVMAIGAAALFATQEQTTARTLALTDAGDYIRCTNAGTTTITVPTNAAVPFVIGVEIVFRRAGGPLAIANAGVTVNNSALVATVAANGNFALKKVATDTWDAI